MKDRNGNELKCGDKVIVFPHGKMAGFTGFVRKFKQNVATAEDHVRAMVTDTGDDEFWEAAWVESREVEKVA